MTWMGTIARGHIPCHTWMTISCDVTDDVVAQVARQRGRHLSGAFENLPSIRTCVSIFHMSDSYHR